MTIIVSKDGKNAQKLEAKDFPNENYLQEYIIDNPDSIPLYDVKENIKLLIIAREFSTTSGPIDALGIDQDGEIYIIETKFYKNPDKRRVVAQVLDYGASLWKNYSDFEEFYTKIDSFTETNFHISFDQRLREFFGSDDEVIERLHENISSNLKDGNLKFVILMDRLHRELKDLITFLNQNSKFDIYAVELEYYKHEDNEIMIPKLFGSDIKKTTTIKYDRTGPRTEDYHFERADEMTKSFYEKLKASVLEFGEDVKIIPLKFYIAFKRNTNFMDVEFRRSKILVFLNMKQGTLDDPEKMGRDVSDIGHYGNGQYEFTIENPDQIEYVVSLAKKSYDKN